jgi:ankyrin repeat protein
VRALLHAGACAETSETGGARRTPLHCAAAVGSADSVAALLDAGASPLAATRAGLAPAALAARRGDADGAAAAALLVAATARTANTPPPGARRSQLGYGDPSLPPSAGVRAC